MVKPGERGFSLAMVMLVLLTTILGSMAIASRSTSGLMAARSQSSNREARDVAESGSTEIISELNKEQNRRLLVTPAADWGSSQVNPCSRVDATGTLLSTVPTPSSKALSLSSGWKNLNSADSTKQYKLDSISIADFSRSQLGSTLAPAQKYGTDKSIARLTVSGRITDANGNEKSTSTLSREYEVVPKCCKRSFGMNSTSATNFGLDKRTCFDGTNSGLGIIVALKGGELKTSNNTFDMFDPTFAPITRVLCASATGNSKCDSQQLKIGKNISVIPTTFSTPFPTYPGAVSSRGNLNTTSKRYLRTNGSAVEQCELPTGGTTTLQEPCDPLPYCEKVGTEYYCRLSTINSSNTETIIDSSNGKINLFFDDPNSSADYINLGGNGSLSHVSCASQSGTTACSQPATFSAVERFNIYINGTGTLNLRGSSSALALNVFNLNGSTVWKGGGSATPNFIGRMWTNALDAKGGSLKIQVPDSQPTQFCPIINQCPVGTGGNPDVDWVARSITQSSNF